MTLSDRPTEGSTSPPTKAHSSNVLMGIRNAFKLGGALICTWGIGIAIRLMMPRHMGPDLFGTYTFADAFTATAFFLLGLGADVYLRKEVALKPEIASELFGGLVIVRVAMTAILVPSVVLIGHGMHRDTSVLQALLVLSLGQFFISLNATLSALLHAKGKVNAMSILGVASKLLWGGGILVAMHYRSPLWVFALAVLASEALESVALYLIGRKHVALRFRVNVTETRNMLKWSFPFYLSSIAAYFGNRLDVTILSTLTSDRETGYLGAAESIASLTLMLTPLVSWVLIPTFSRAKAESDAQFTQAIRRAMEVILAVAIPASLIAGAGADIWTRVLFGPVYTPSTMALRILSSTFAIIYVSILCAQGMILLDRRWTLTMISTGSLILSPILNILLIPPMLRWLGPGGGSTGAAVARLVNELFVVTAMMLVVGGRLFDRRSLVMVAKSLGACACAVLVDRIFVSLGFYRLFLDAAVYLGLVLATGAVQFHEIRAIVMAAVRRKEPV